MAGRETKYSEEIHASIVADLTKGQTRACAAEIAGIGERTLYRWLTRGKKGDAPFAAFLADVKKAERKAERKMVGIVRAAARQTWQAAAWWLERKFPESWGKDTELLREIVAAYRKRKRAKAR